MTLFAVEHRHWRFRSFRKCESVLNRHAHIRCTDLGNYASVIELNHGMDLRLRMNHHFHFVGGEVEKPASLDDLKSFVHQSGRVYGDSRAHLPRWVVQGLSWSNSGELDYRSL